MTLIEGKYADAKVFASVLEDKAAEQIRTLCDQPFVQGSRIRVMPDVHAGAGCTIGTTMTAQSRGSGYRLWDGNREARRPPAGAAKAG